MGILARFPGTSGDYATAPDNAAFSALTDFSVVALVSLDDWTPAAFTDIASHHSTTGNQRSWRFGVDTAGRLALVLSTNGTAASTFMSTVATGFTDGTKNWVLVTRASASGNLNFYTAAYSAGTFTPPAIGSFSLLGTGNVAGTTGTLHNSTASLSVGASTAGTVGLLDGDVYRFSLYTGIYGGGSETLVRDFFPTDAGDTTDTSWTSSATGETWTLNGGDVVLVGDTVTGVAAGASTSTGSASGIRTVLGASSGAAAGTGTATGLRTVHGAAAGASTASGSATGTGTTPGGEVTGAGSGAATSSGTATGTRTVLGSASGAATATGAASGTKTVSGAAAGSSTATGSASGLRTVLGVASGTGTATGSASGTRTVGGACSGSSTATGTCSGTRTTFGFCAGGATSSGTATGRVPNPAAPTRYASFRERTTATFQEPTTGSWRERRHTGRHRERTTASFHERTTARYQEA